MESLLKSRKMDKEQMDSGRRQSIASFPDDRDVENQKNQGRITYPSGSHSLPKTIPIFEELSESNKRRISLPAYNFFRLRERSISGYKERCCLGLNVSQEECNSRPIIMYSRESCQSGSSDSNESLPKPESVELSASGVRIGQEELSESNKRRVSLPASNFITLRSIRDDQLRRRSLTPELEATFFKENKYLTSC